jgi:hypothetical protein
MDQSSIGVVVQDIKVMTKVFLSASFVHVKRSLNVAAHI